MSQPEKTEYKALTPEEIGQAAARAIKKIKRDMVKIKGAGDIPRIGRTTALEDILALQLFIKALAIELQGAIGRGEDAERTLIKMREKGEVHDSCVAASAMSHVSESTAYLPE